MEAIWLVIKVVSLTQFIQVGLSYAHRFIYEVKMVNKVEGIERLHNKVYTSSTNQLPTSSPQHFVESFYITSVLCLSLSKLLQLSSLSQASPTLYKQVVFVLASLN